MISEERVVSVCGKKCRRKDCFFNRDTKIGQDDPKKQSCLNTVDRIRSTKDRCLSYIDIADLNGGFSAMFDIGDVVMIPDTMVERRKYGSMHHKKDHRFIITKMDLKKHRAFGLIYSEPNERELEDGLKAVGKKTEFMFTDLISTELLRRAKGKEETQRPVGEEGRRCDKGRWK